jgi:hypothetical protein
MSFLDDPFFAYGIGGSFGVAITIAGCLLSDEFETNEYAMAAIALEHAVVNNDQETGLERLGSDETGFWA